MGRYSIAEAEKVHVGGGGTDFFSIPDDGMIKKGRIMFNGVEDVGMDLVHMVEVNGKERMVSCLCAPGDSADSCPFCKARIKRTLKLHIPIYDMESKSVKIWQRGKQFASTLSAAMNRAGTPVCGNVFEIERHGKKGDAGTTYNLWPGQNDGTKLSDLPEVPDLYGSLIMDKSFDEMEQFVKTGSFDKVEESSYADVPTDRLRRGIY